jgi:hypothetical protein
MGAAIGMPPLLVLKPLLYSRKTHVFEARLV